MLTEEQRLRRNERQRNWKKNNKEKVNAINRAVKAKRPERYREINRVSIAKMRLLDPDRFRAIADKARDKNPGGYLVAHAKCRAKQLGVAFDLRPEDVAIPELCPVLGIKLQWNYGKRASANHSSPSLDRVDGRKGYVKGNVVVISNRANHLRNNATAKELQLVADYATKVEAGWRP